MTGTPPPTQAAAPRPTETPPHSPRATVTPSPATRPTVAPPGATRPTLVPPRAAWSAVIPALHTLTLTDLHGNQAVDFLVYDAHDTATRYSAPDTLHAQGSLFLTTGSVLLSTEHTPLMTVTADEVGRHDTVGGACSKESNTLRYGHHTWSQHACVDNFLAEGARHGLGKRDLVSNVNWFMNVPVEPDGTLGIVDGRSAPGRSLTLRADTDVLVLVSNCPQINNPCNGFEPTAVELTIGAPG
ncbi:urea amidolyase associated protein UAAP2 [Streptomyces sp. NPDC048290]|uniref:urea amidolyase associated protein UAAP2 n=1 Tax=Streptomyces sp. NPDC048290 TaxID=3155811 RepID=UPI00342E28C7